MFGRTLAPGILLAAALAACSPPAVSVDSGMQVRRATRSEVLVSADGRSVSIVPPEGYCVMRDSVRTGEKVVFSLMGECTPDASAEDADDRAPAGLLTASVSYAPLFHPTESHDDSLDALEEFLGSDRGLSLVGRGGAAERLKILESYRENDALLLLVENSGEQVIPISAPHFWRAFLELNDRMVSVSVSTFRDRPAEDRQMLALLRRFIAGLREANKPELLAGGLAVATTQEARPGPAPATPPAAPADPADR
ncbi:hypothetical protein FDP22_00730 [Paroceanicella profunda]|uniref:Uncharacterized protein n=1 Tax=Paroceanicella profunda TaxID=2579971 RepID=A0A5B8FQ32_9RHOB|nr:hypothetical protein [Paroceanicella profunda]QDL90445.1 hypothetical protein FDP22_00730 [Paroceanicella profunda]